MFTLEILKLLGAGRKTLKTFRRTRHIREFRSFADAETLESVTRNAMAYAFEVGKGKPLSDVLTTSADNPFLVADWRKGVVESG